MAEKRKQPAAYRVLRTLHVPAADGTERVYEAGTVVAAAEVPATLDPTSEVRDGVLSEVSDDEG